MGIATLRGRTPSCDAEAVRAMRDTLTHRGPDDAGLLDAGNVILGHTRLAVIDPTPAGHQPMVTSEGAAIAWNGELYNDLDLRAELACEGVRFETACDTETLLSLLARRIDAGTPLADIGRTLARCRGMFAIAYVDPSRRMLMLACDPLGVKPLYYTIRGDEIVFGSEIPAILAHPDVSPEPDPLGVRSYLTTLRTTIGERTMFAGVRTLLPGQILVAHLDGDALDVRTSFWWRAPAIEPSMDSGEAVARVHDAMAESVPAHLRADVPVCALLSGGIDSTVTTVLSKDVLPDLRTWCAGAQIDDAFAGDDLAWARKVAGELGTDHHEAIVTRESFLDRWPWLVREQGLPLSTPNEVAIHAVASSLREAGCVVTISGEGADELMGGYGMVLERVLAEGADGGTHLDSATWVPEPMAFLMATQPGSPLAMDEPTPVRDVYQGMYGHAIEEAGGAGPDAHARLIRMLNLTQLLRRLDSATMRASVEGRTPFADVRVAEAISAIPLALHYAPPETKRTLRAAFADRVPADVLARPKASFPLPFQSWIGERGGVLAGSATLRTWLAPRILDEVAADPGEHWRLAWPLINLGLWADRWWA